MRILMVCLGNICRSPLAEGILKKKIERFNLPWEVDSAGTGAYHIGQMPDSRSIAVANRYGIDITDQRARQIHRRDLRVFDLILTMDNANFRKVRALSRSEEEAAKIKMIMTYIDEDGLVEVPDPYWDDDGFEQVYRMLDEATDKLIEKALGK